MSMKKHAGALDALGTGTAAADSGARQFVALSPRKFTARAFVWLQGDRTENFNNYQIQRILLRGIAWAANKPVDTLLDYVPPPRPVRQGQMSGDNQ